MSREIKYRAWFHKSEPSKNGNYMLYMRGIVRGETYPRLHNNLLTKDIRPSIDHVSWDNFWSNVFNFRGNVSLMQYTGLNDRNGKEIYEGDIVKGYRWDAGKSHRLIGEVKYVSNRFVVNGIGNYNKIRDDIDGSYEVIGNIYENTEILK